MKILLVDDNPELLEATRDVLEALGHSVVPVGSAEAALEECDLRGSFDALLVDYRLPGLNGLELFQRWVGPRVPAVLMTSHARDPEVVAGVVRYGIPVLAKPFSVKELEDALDLAFRHKPSRPSAEWLRSGQQSKNREPHQGALTGNRVGLLGAAVAATLVLFVGTGSLLNPTPPAVPRPPSLDVVRGAVLEVETPVGPLVEIPQELAWQGLGGTQQYVVWLEAVDGQVLFQGETVSTELTLPKELTDGLQVGVAYYWWVEALNEQGARLARSEQVRFRVIQSLTTIDVEETTR